MAVYYNEIDPYCCEWLRALIAKGYLPAGDVDERDVREVSHDDLKGYKQAHFFAGIGGWPLALDLARWPEDRPVWTGSCPCQPFSVAGKGKAFSDERHLWPAWFRLIKECRPATVYGEQVNAAVRWGWLDLVFDDMEREGYACGAAVLPACSVGAPHIRQRLWFVANAEGQDGQVSVRIRGSHETMSELGGPGGFSGMAHTERGADQRHGPELAGAEEDGSGEAREQWLRDDPWDGKSTDGMADAALDGWARAQGTRAGGTGASHCSGVDYTAVEGLQERASGTLPSAEALRVPERSSHSHKLGDPYEPGSQGRGLDAREHPGQRSPWETGSLVWLPCTDGRSRPAQPGIFPLADGIPRRVAILRAAGNAIVPQNAATFIEATM